MEELKNNVFFVTVFSVCGDSQICKVDLRS